MVEVGLVALKRLGFSVRYIDLEGKDVIRLPASPSSSEVQTVVMFRALPWELEKEEQLGSYTGNKEQKEDRRR